jgi:hypothetical protein
MILRWRGVCRGIEFLFFPMFQIVGCRYCDTDVLKFERIQLIDVPWRRHRLDDCELPTPASDPLATKSPSFALSNLLVCAGRRDANTH